ncbi:hypothetical protein BH09PSE5_BH09PSE5_03670 [soil metagenome]
MILGEVFECNARCFGDKPALIFEGRPITHRQFAQRVVRLINALVAKGLKRQDRLAVVSRNCPEYLEVYGAAGLGDFMIFLLILAPRSRWKKPWRMAAP